MAEASIEKTLEVDFKDLYKVITTYEDYPQFVDGVTSVSVARKDDRSARVTYTVSMMKEFTYVLDLSEDPVNGKVSWELVESDFFKKNSGSWKIKSLGEGRTQAQYDLEVEFSVPVPGFILKKLVKGSLPTMMKNFEERAQSIGG